LVDVKYLLVSYRRKKDEMSKNQEDLKFSEEYI